MFWPQFVPCLAFQQLFVVAAAAPASYTEAWQLLCGLEAVLCLVLFAGWLMSAKHTPRSTAGDRETQL